MSFRKRSLSDTQLVFLRRHKLMEERENEESEENGGGVENREPSEMEKALYAAVGRLTKDVEDIDKDALYATALKLAQTENSVQAGLDWLERSVPISSKVETDFVEVVFDRDKRAFQSLRKAFGEDDRRIEAMHKAFGGRSGLPALRSILDDVCRGQVSELKRFADAMEG